MERRPGKRHKRPASPHAFREACRAQTTARQGDPGHQVHCHRAHFFGNRQFRWRSTLLMCLYGDRFGGVTFAGDAVRWGAFRWWPASSVRGVIWLVFGPNRIRTSIASSQIIFISTFLSFYSFFTFHRHKHLPLITYWLPLLLSSATGNLNQLRWVARA